MSLTDLIADFNAEYNALIEAELNSAASLLDATPTADDIDWGDFA